MAGSSATAWAREADAIRLFERAATGETVELAELSGAERCVLAGPGSALWEQPAAGAWDELDEERRATETGRAVAGLRARRLLLEEVSEGAGGSAWSMAPELGIIQAARRKPAYVVTTEIQGKEARCLRFFAVGDTERPVRGVVVEEPVALPSTGSYMNARNPGPLGWTTRYCVLSETSAVGVLTDVALVPRQDKQGKYPYVIRRLQYDAGQPTAEAGLSVIGAGSSARVRLFHGGSHEEGRTVATDAEGLRGLLLRLLATGGHS
jgi:hypothetical protein